MFVLLLSAFLAEPSGKDIVPEGAKLVKLFTRTAKIEGGLTEGPAVAPDGSIYFSDIPVGTDKGLIMRYDPMTGKTEVWNEDSKKSNGLKFDASGNLVACEGSDHGGRAVVRYDMKTKKRTVIADSYKGKRFNAPNDLVIDAKGRIFFSDPRYLGDEPRELEYRAVYRIDTDGTVTEVSHDVEKPNGVGLSPDGKTLYVADHNNGTDKITPGVTTKPGAMKVYAFTLDEKGNATGKKTIYDFGTQAGCDGMCVDSKGHIYLTARGLKRPGVLVITPEGKEVAFIPTGPADQDATKEPVGLPSNVTFGIGKESKTLYVTVDRSLYKIELAVEGHHPAKK